VAECDREIQPRDMPLYWFAKLQRAVEEGDFEGAAESQRELARLGVRVAYGRPSPDQPEVNRSV